MIDYNNAGYERKKQWPKPDRFHYLGNLMIGTQPKNFYGMDALERTFETLQDAISTVYEELGDNPYRDAKSVVLIGGELKCLKNSPLCLLASDRDKILFYLEVMSQELIDCSNAVIENLDGLAEEGM